MSIDWFPGHMTKARREAGEAMRTIDVVIEVLDARVPLASLNPMLDDMRRELKRPALMVLNKADVADPKQTAAWLAWWNARPETRAIALSASKAGEAAKIPKACLQLAPGRTSVLKPLRLLILGIPNVGKSTLMNALLKRHVAHVGDEPAITKNQSRHALSPTSWIVDTPGMMWPGVDQGVAHLLAATHSIGRAAYHEENIAIFLGELLLRDYPHLLAARYGTLPEACTPSMLLQHIAKARRMVKDELATAATLLLKEFRDGVIGRISLERPPKA